MTLAPAVSQIEITMLVSVENLEEAGETVSLQLQIRRYWTGEHCYPPPFPLSDPATETLRRPPYRTVFWDACSSDFPVPLPQRLVSESWSPIGSSFPGLTLGWHAVCGGSSS